MRSRASFLVQRLSIAFVGACASQQDAERPIVSAGPEPQAPPTTTAPPVNLALRTIAPDEPVYPSANTSGKRLGTLVAGREFSVSSLIDGPGCQTQFASIAKDAWVCIDGHTVGPPSPLRANADPVPTAFAFVGQEGAIGYRDLNLQGSRTQMDAGWGVGIVGRRHFGNFDWVTTASRLWVETSSLRAASPSELTGKDTASENLTGAGWLAESSPLYERPAKTSRILRRLPRMSKVTIGDESANWLNTEHGYLETRFVRRFRPAKRPEGVGEHERWIDVDTQEQVLTAYRGNSPVFIALVSTGKAATPTRPGSFRIWGKLYQSDMDNLEEEGDGASKVYRMEAVPYVQFFDGSIALHGTYWHDRFGTPRSHGCVNLSIADARWLFAFTAPVLPAGWAARMSTGDAQATVVQIR